MEPRPRSSGGEPLLSIRSLTTEFDTPDGVVHAVNGVSYDVYPGETLGIVGESGSGKSVTVLSVLGLIPSPPGRIAGGEVWFQGTDLLSLSNAELRRIRGRDIGMVFQDPMTSLNPVFTVGDQIAEAMLVHDRIGEAEARRKLLELYFQSVGAAQERDASRLFGWQKELTARTITGLVEKRKLVTSGHPKQKGEWLVLPELVS